MLLYVPWRNNPLTMGLSEVNLSYIQVARRCFPPLISARAIVLQMSLSKDLFNLPSRSPSPFFQLSYSLLLLELYQFLFTLHVCRAVQSQYLTVPSNLEALPHLFTSLSSPWPCSFLLISSPKTSRQLLASAAMHDETSRSQYLDYLRNSLVSLLVRTR